MGSQDEKISTDEESHRLVSAIKDKGHDDVAEMVHDLHVKRERRNDMFLRTLQEIRDEMKADREMINNLRTAFPGDDPRGHREAHEAWIERELLNKELKKSIINKTLVGLVWVVLLYIGKSVWENVKDLISL